MVAGIYCRGGVRFGTQSHSPDGDTRLHGGSCSRWQFHGWPRLNTTAAHGFTYVIRDPPIRSDPIRSDPIRCLDLQLIVCALCRLLLLFFSSLSHLDLLFLWLCLFWFFHACVCVTLIFFFFQLPMSSTQCHTYIRE